MTRFAKLLTKLLTLAPLLMACNTFQLHPFELGITLPYSERCRFRNVVTKETREIDPIECEEIKKRSLVLTPEAWRVIRTDIQNNCAAQQCLQLRGKVDELFLVIDQGLNQLPY